jgi:hypothetical protein
MDREHFDALARVLGTSGSRRGTVGALVGAALFGAGLEVDARRKKGKKRKKRGPRPCFGDKSCAFPSDGLDFEACDLDDKDFSEDCSGCNFRRANLRDADLNDFSNFYDGDPRPNFQGTSFREANLRGADLAFIDASGASFRDACLAGADFTGAKTDGADFRGAIFCATINPDGSVNNSGCDEAEESRCCPACLFPGDACEIVDGIDPCCDTECDEELGVCAIECEKDFECDEGEFCCDNVCVASCCFDSQCFPLGFDFCVGGICVECAEDSDCEGSDHCCDGVCQECCHKNHCDPNQGCADGECLPKPVE